MKKNILKTKRPVKDLAIHVSYLAAKSSVLNASEAPRDMTIKEIVIPEWEAKSNGNLTIQVVIIDHDDGDKKKTRNLTSERITIIA